MHRLPGWETPRSCPSARIHNPPSLPKRSALRTLGSFVLRTAHGDFETYCPNCVVIALPASDTALRTELSMRNVVGNFHPEVDGQIAAERIAASQTDHRSGVGRACTIGPRLAEARHQAHPG